MPKAAVSSPTTIKALQTASSLKELAALLGLEPKELSYTLYIYPGPKYSTFQIPKKSGGHRIIDAPIDRLKSIQRKLADLLNACVKEIDEQHGRKPIAHGFREGRSIITNASPHTGRRFVLNLDLENFFPSINFGRARGFFISNNDFKLAPQVATVIAQIACDQNTLPQGSPSDEIYLKVAIQQLASKFPNLIDTTTSPPKLKVRFFKYRSRISDLLHVTGGTAPLRPLIEKYEENVDRYNFSPLQFPVIVLIDNDPGTKNIFPLINGKYKLNATLKTTAKFYPVCKNLYVVKTPEKNPTGESMIEDCFDPTLLATSFNGKTFNPDDDKLGPNEFGKVALGGVVRSNADTIDFTGFEPLLDRISSVINHYKP